MWLHSKHLEASDMKARIVRIGNSQGNRISKLILEQQERAGCSRSNPHGGLGTACQAAGPFGCQDISAGRKCLVLCQGLILALGATAVHIFAASQRLAMSGKIQPLGIP